MSFWQKILTWERKLHKFPKRKLFSLGLIAFCTALIFGALFLTEYDQLQNSSIDAIARNIEKNEKNRMDKRVEQLKITRYSGDF